MAASTAECKHDWFIAWFGRETAVEDKKRLGKDEVGRRVWGRREGSSLVTQRLNDMQATHLGNFFGYLICFDQNVQCHVLTFFVEQIVFYVRVRKVNLNK